MSDSCGKRYRGVTQIVAGSKREGVSKPFRGDLDVMKVFDDVICTEDIRHFVNIVCQSRAGPSLPCALFGGASRLNCPVFFVDNVIAFTCHCPSLFEKFLNRPRRHGWPPPDILQELSQLEAHVVPVGDKTSEDYRMQWRICFTKAEIRLIEYLTEPQIHVFVLLKIFAKEVLKKVWDKITSYIMKNVILWMVELTPAHKFRTNVVVDRFLDCMLFLKLCIKSGFLPSYMISERNLLRHDHFIVKKRKIVDLLDECLNEKGSCLLRSNTMKESLLKMYIQADMLMLYGLKRDQVELFASSGLLRIAHALDLDTVRLQDNPYHIISRHHIDVWSMLMSLLEIFPMDKLIRDPTGYMQMVIDML